MTLQQQVRTISILPPVDHATIQQLGRREREGVREREREKEREGGREGKRERKRIYHLEYQHNQSLTTSF